MPNELRQSQKKKKKNLCYTVPSFSLFYSVLSCLASFVLLDAIMLLIKETMILSYTLAGVYTHYSRMFDVRTG